MNTFTKEDVIAEAHRRYQKPVCTDCLKNPRWPGNQTFQECVSEIISDSVYWDYPDGNLFNEENWKNILPPK